MSRDLKQAARGCLFILGPIIWLICIAAMGLMAVVFIEMGTEPPHENKLAGVVLLPLAPTIPIGVLIASGLLWLRWQAFRAVNQALTEIAAAATGSLLVGFALAFFFPFELFTALLAAVTLFAHVLSLVVLHIQEWVAGRGSS